ncbi:MAG TPA: hypothetical protein VGF44_04160 [Terriglobales bacterium]|jgi:hypothetical protein
MSEFVKVCDRNVKVDGRLLRMARIDGEKYTFPDDPELLVRELRASGTRADLFTFLQKLPDTAPKYSYHMELDNLAVLPVSTFENWWNNQLRSFPRNRARQAEKRGVVFREVPYGEELIEGICGIYNETPIRQGKRFPHYGMTSQQAQAYAGTFLDRSVYIGGFFEGKMIGFIKLTTDESNTQSCLVHILSMVQHKDKAPTNALIAQAVKSCAARKVPFLVYEHFTYGKKKEDSLSHFKEVNAFQRVDLPRYYIPLTALGKFALRHKLHHKLVDRIPESWANRLRDFRRDWYNRKVQGAAEQT